MQIIFRKIADVKRERELAEIRKNEGLDQLGSDHPVRKLISKFRKISQESRAATQTPPTTSLNSPAQQSSTIQPTATDPNDSSPTTNTASLPIIIKPRDKLETISERIETQESQLSQITSVHQSPPLQRPPKSSKWKWLKTGSTGPETDSPPRQTGPDIKRELINPFDSNLTEDDIQGQTANGNERRPSIPLSLFIPRSARRHSTNASDVSIDDHVRH